MSGVRVDLLQASDRVAVWFRVTSLDDIAQLGTKQAQALESLSRKGLLWFACAGLLYVQRLASI